MMRNRGLNFTATGIGLATIPALCLNDAAAIAQIPAGAQTMPQVNVLFVNPAIGNDLIGNGSKRAPFKTITQALRIAQTNNVIVLSSDTYSNFLGETFPLMLKPGVSIQADPHTQAHQTGLTVVTVTNPNRCGYSLWIQSSSPVVIDRNGAHGMKFYGTSRPQVQVNTKDGVVAIATSQPDLGNPIQPRTTPVELPVLQLETSGVSQSVEEDARTTTEMAPVDIPVPPLASTAPVPPIPSSPPQLFPVPSQLIANGTCQLPKVAVPQTPRASSAGTPPLLPRPIHSYKPHLML